MATDPLDLIQKRLDVPGEALATRPVRSPAGLEVLGVVIGILDRRIAEFRRLESQAGDAYVVMNGIVHILGGVRNEVERDVIKWLMSAAATPEADHG